MVKKQKEGLWKEDIGVKIDMGIKSKKGKR